MDIILGEALFFFCVILSCLLVFRATRSGWSSRRATMMPPGPPRLPIIGNIHQVGVNPHHSLANLSKTYGPVMSLKLGSLNTVVISSPEAAREVLKTHDQILYARKYPNSIQAIKHHLFSVAWLHPTTTLWRLLRKLSVTQLFSLQRMEATKAVQTKAMQELVRFISESIDREEAVDISSVSFITVLNIISNILFSIDLGSYDPKMSTNEFQDLVTGVMKAIGKPDAANYFPFLGFLDLQGNRKTIRFYSERLFMVIRGFVDAKRAEKSLRRNPSDVPNNDLADALLDYSEGDEAELNADVIEHFLFDIFTAGTDTSSSTVEWAMTEMLRNPKTMKKMQAEIDHVIGNNGVIHESDISKLLYLQAVVKETFRLHPPAPLLLPRKAGSDVEVLGFMVPKDAQVLVNVWAIGRDPTAWENPTQFQPERFLGNKIDVKGRDYELTPFGAGRRICPGLPLAMKTISLIVAYLLYFFDWKLPNGVVAEDLDMDETFGITLHKTISLHVFPVKKRAIYDF